MAFFFVSTISAINFDGMTPKQFIKNMTFDNLYYIRQAKKRKKEWTQEQIDEQVNRKALLCPGCWDQGACVHCGCNIYDMFISDKPCEDGKF